MLDIRCLGAFGENLSKVRSWCAADLAINISHGVFQRVHSGGHEGLWCAADLAINISHGVFQRVHSGGHEGLWFVADF